MTHTHILFIYIHLKRILYLDYRGAKGDVGRPIRRPATVIQEFIGKWIV